MSSTSTSTDHSMHDIYIQLANECINKYEERKISDLQYWIAIAGFTYLSQSLSLSHSLSFSLLFFLSLSHSLTLSLSLGGPGSGKSTLSAAVSNIINHKAGTALSVVIPMDGYHLSRQQLKEMSEKNGIAYVFLFLSLSLSLSANDSYFLFLALSISLLLPLPLLLDLYSLPSLPPTSLSLVLVMMTY